MGQEPKPLRTLGFYAIAWIETFLVHGPGDVQGQKIELDDEFAAFILRAYELDEVGARRVRRAFLSRPKGRSKSGLAAMIVCFEALGECRFDHWAEPGEVSDWGYEFEPGEPVGRQVTYAEILNVATEEGQAGHTYDGVHYMLHRETCSAELLDRFGPLDVGLTRTFLPDSRGFIEPVSASNESKDGGKSTFIVADETHLWIPPGTGVFKLGRMHQTMVRNLFKRKEASGWMLETSTMYAAGENSVAEGTHNYAKAGGGKLLFDHREASAHWDIEDRGQRIEALREVYGPAAEWMDLEAIADYWDDPQASDAEFRRFWLNQPIALGRSVFDIRRWASEPLCNRSAPAPTRVVLAVAATLDRSRACIGVAGAAGECGDKTLVMCHRAPLSDIAAKVADIVKKRDVVEVVLAGAAPRGGVIPRLTQLGVEFVVMPSAELAASCVAFQQAVKDGSLVHVGQDELDVAVAHARTRMVGESEYWDRRDVKADDSPLVACSAAIYRWGLQKANYNVLESVW